MAPKAPPRAVAKSWRRDAKEEVFMASSPENGTALVLCRGNFAKLNHNQPKTITIANPDACLGQHGHDPAMTNVPH
jgi:hypothetical protein